MTLALLDPVRARFVACAGLVGVLLCAAAGCADDPDALILDVTADQNARRLRVEVKGPAKKPALPFEFDTDPADTGLDITDPGQAYQLALRFGASGRYGVHIVDITAGPTPTQSWSAEFDVSGVVRDKAHLVMHGPGDDDDGDGWSENCPEGAPECPRDCNDGDPNTNPFAVDICMDGVDQDCTGSDRPCEDGDGDGYDETQDCDDFDPEVNPGIHEASTLCDGADRRCDDDIDNDCDGMDSVCHTDADCDGHFPTGEPDGDDCNDNDADIYPGAIDVCDDGIDQDCDLSADDGCERCDEDGDGEYGQHPERGCDVAPEMRDCDDANRGAFHGSTADCGGQEGAPACKARGMCSLPAVDDDCDGMANEGCPDASCDIDGDGFAIMACATPPPAGMADCNDADARVYPGAPDICNDSILQNCNIDLPCSQDADGDGYNAGADCNDADLAIHPWAIELCNAKDDDCDGHIDEGNPTVAPGGTLDDSNCNFDNDGLCGSGTPGRCVCSPTLSDGIMDASGDRALCPGEAGGPWGPRCFGAVQPTYEQCDSLDQDCNEIPDAPTGENMDPAVLGLPCHGLPGPCVQGHVIGCDLSQSHPWYDNPAYVCSSDERGPQSETCNGVNDDCDGQTDEGFGLGTPCDGADGDLCNEGQIACNGSGGTVCNDGTGTNMELCNLLDDDCDGQLNEGYVLGMGCDGGDTDLCNEGVTVCNLAGNGTVCSDVSGNNAETCNNSDDDCDGTTDEGFPNKGMACDGGDTDLCQEGVFVCNGMGTATTCNDPLENDVESCNAFDDDCDGSTDEDFPTLGMGCDGGDGDLCVEGTVVCFGGSAVCNDGTGTTSETCNNFDDDCDLTIDDGAGPTCGPLGDTCASGGNCRCGSGALCSTTVADNCSAGACRCGSGAACSSMNSNNCTGGNCRCGSAPACTGLSDTCTAGNCRCGSGSACSSTLADSCQAGACKCGVGPSCSAMNANNCTGGMCRCGANPACTGLSDTCSAGTCLCGGGAACDPAKADSCTAGACKCGMNDPCPGMQTCVAGSCS